MDIQSSQSSSTQTGLYKSESVFLTSCLNDKVLGERLKHWQDANALFLTNNVMFAPQAKSEYETLVKELSQCFIAFIGCRHILSKLPKNEEELNQILEENAKLGKWCLWHIDARYIELIVERLLSMRTEQTEGSERSEKTEITGHDKEQSSKTAFNPCDLIVFKIPQQAIGENAELKPWMCQENIAQIRNQEADAGKMILTALANQQFNEDTAAEFSKILEQELQLFDVETVIEFAEHYGIDVTSAGKFDLSKNDKNCLNTVLRILREEHSLGLYTLASYAVTTLINYRFVQGSLSDTAFRIALGQAIQALGMPRNSDIFSSKSFARGGFVAYKSTINSLFRQQSGFENRRNAEDKELDWQGLEKRYKELLVLNQSKNGSEVGEREIANFGLSKTETTNLGLNELIFSQHELGVIRKFIAAAQSSYDEFVVRYQDLCFIDWPRKLELLFEASKPNPKKAKLSERTIDLFEASDRRNLEAVREQVTAEAKAQGEDANQAMDEWLKVHAALDESEKETLALADLRPNKMQDEDRQQLESFFNTHRSELSADRKLYGDWERLICQQKITCTDFCVGLSQLLISLNSEQSDLIKISLVLEEFKAPVEFLRTHNFAMCSFFSIMYSPLLRKLQEAFPQKFMVEVKRNREVPHPLLDFPEFFEYCASQAKVSEIKCTKDSDKALQLNFKVVMQLRSDNGQITKNTGALQWSMDSSSVGLMLHHDLELIVQEQTPLCSFFVRKLLSSLDGIQTMSLNNLSGFFYDAALQPGAFINDLVDASDLRYKQNDVSVQNTLYVLKPNLERTLIKQFEAENCSSEDEQSAWDDPLLDIGESVEPDSFNQEFTALCQQYVQTIESMLQGRMSFSQVKALYEQYSLLQLHILQSSKSIEQRNKLLSVVQSIGLAYEYRDKKQNMLEFAVATPYNIHSMYNHMLRLERLYHLVEIMLSQRMFVTKHKVMLEALAEAQEQPCGPEVIASKHHLPSQNYVLKAVQNVYGYTLYQAAVFSLLQEAKTATQKGMHYSQGTLFDVEEQVEQSIDYLQSYVTTHPQVRELFNVVIFNCDDQLVIKQLYKRLANSDFFSTVNICLYVVNENQALLSREYHDFESFENSIQEESDKPSSSGNVRLIVLNQQETSELNHRLSLHTSSSMLQVVNPQLTEKSNNYMFDAGLLLHACDSQAKFTFSEQELPIAQHESDLFHDHINFANSQKNTGISNLFLVSAEQNWGGLVYLHALYCQIRNAVNSNVLNELSSGLNNESGSYLTAGQDGSYQTVGNGKAGNFYQRAVGAVGNLGAGNYLIQTYKTPVPVFQLTVSQASEMGHNVDYVHDIAKEVLILDTLMTKEQLNELKIKIVKYQQSAHTNTNIFVSTKRGIDTCKQRLASLFSEMNENELISEQSFKSILDKALSLSGGLIQHAQIADIYTNEMLGLVLSRYVALQIAIKLNCPRLLPESSMDKLGLSVLGSNSRPLNEEFRQQPEVTSKGYAFFMLDEYASWFGSKTGERSDILMLNVGKQANSRYLLRIMIVESKFVHDAVSVAAAKSLNQSKAAAETFFDLFSHDNAMCTVDRKLRLHQLKTMLARSSIMESLKSDALRFQQDLLLGKIDIALTSVSCVYGYKDPQSGSAVEMQSFDYGSTENNTLPHKPKGIQLIFRSQAVKQLLNSSLRESRNSKALDEMLFTRPQMQDFLAQQMSVALDASPAERYKRKAIEQPVDDKSQQSKSEGVTSEQENANTVEQTTKQTAGQNAGLTAEQTAKQTAGQSEPQQAAQPSQVKDPAQEVTDSTKELTPDSVKEPAQKATSDSTQEPAPSQVEELAQDISNTEEPILMATPAGQSELFIEDDASFNHADTPQAVAAKAQDTSKVQDTQPAANDEHTASSSQDNELTTKQPEQPKTKQSENKQSEIKQPEQPETKNSVPQMRTLRKHRHSIFDEMEKTEVIQPPAPKTEQETSPEDNSELSAQEQQLLNQFFELHSDFAQLVQDTPDVYKDEIEQRTLWAEEMQTNLIKAFEALNMRPEIIRYHLTPNGAVFSFKGNEQFERKKIERCRESLKTTYALNIGQVNAEVGRIDISVQNETADRIKVPYLSICRRRSLNIEHLSKDDGALEGFNSKILLGLLEDSGKFAYLDLKKAAPHLLIGGGTGSGKSNVLNIMLLDLALTNSPNDLRMVLMDPKGGSELGVFEYLPHVEQFVKTKEEAADILVRLADLMDKRFKMFDAKASELGSFAKIPDLVTYNQKVSKEDRLPRIVVVIDEFADWFIDKSFKDVANTSITRICAKARAAGIHLILATQRPDNDVVDTKLRNNLGNQIALKTRDLNNSAIILGNRDHDASRLLGKGHMLCSFEGYKSVFCAQAAFIDNDALGRALEAICNDWYRLDSMDE